MQSLTAYLDKRNVHGTMVYGIRDTAYTLVKRNDQTGDFEPVDKIDKDIPAADLDAKYGVWVDTEKSHWSPTLLHPFHRTVDRPADGKIQADEVVDFPTFRQNQQSIEGHWLYGTSRLYTCDNANIVVGDVGNGDKAPLLQTNWSMQYIEAQYSNVSPLSPPYAAGWRNGMVGD